MQVDNVLHSIPVLMIISFNPQRATYTPQPLAHFEYISNQPRIAVTQHRLYKCIFSGKKFNTVAFFLPKLPARGVGGEEHGYTLS